MSAHGVFYKKIRSKSTLFYVVVFLIVCFASLNVLFSQSYPSLMWEVMERKTDAIVDYLEHIPQTKQYQLEVERLQKDGDVATLDALKMKEAQKDQQIQKLTEAVKAYPQDPELYYNLSILLEEKGMSAQSSINLKKAQELDRGI